MIHPVNAPRKWNHWNIDLVCSLRAHSIKKDTGMVHFDKLEIMVEVLIRIPRGNNMFRRAEGFAPSGISGGAAAVD